MEIFSNSPSEAAYQLAEVVWGLVFEDRRYTRTRQGIVWLLACITIGGLLSFLLPLPVVCLLQTLFSSK